MAAKRASYYWRNGYRKAAFFDISAVTFQYLRSTSTGLGHFPTGNAIICRLSETLFDRSLEAAASAVSEASDHDLVYGLS